LPNSLSLLCVMVPYSVTELGDDAQRTGWDGRDDVEDGWSAATVTDKKGHVGRAAPPF